MYRRHLYWQLYRQSRRLHETLYRRRLWLLVGGLAAVFMVVGVAGRFSGVLWAGTPIAAAPQVVAPQPAIVAKMAATSTMISYQGYLTSAAGAPIDGTAFLRFEVFDQPEPEEDPALWDSGPLEVEVERGLFQVTLDIEPALFDGRDLWLALNLNGQPLTPRQPLLAAPYALGLMPGATVDGEPRQPTGAVFGARLAPAYPVGQALAGHAPATGTAIYAEAAGGQGVYASSGLNYAVRGASEQGWGGYFSSEEGYGVRAQSQGDKHWDHAAYLEANAGYGVLATSASNMAIRGEAGDTEGLWQPVGLVGVVGIGQSRGLYGSSGSSYGVYGTSLNWYGVYGRTNKSDGNYGLYTPDNLYAANLTTSGASMTAARNGGSETLQPGDVVAVNGLDEATIAGGDALLQVARAHPGNQHALMGVVYGRFNLATLAEDFEPTGDVEISSFSPILPGEGLLVVTHGVAPVNVNALSAGVAAGDPLIAGPDGVATRMGEQAAIAQAETGLPPAILGTALEAATGEQKQIQVFVTVR